MLEFNVELLNCLLLDIKLVKVKSDRNSNSGKMWLLYALIETAEDSLICRVYERPTACTDDDLGSKLAVNHCTKVS